MEFYPLRIQNIHALHEDAVQLQFDIPHELAETFRYKPGQYITVETEIAGASVRRSYSICSHHSEPLSIGIKRIPNGLFSSHAVEQLKVGDTLQVSAPDGMFIHDDNPESEACYVGFAAGSGITPVLSMLKTVLLEQPKAQFVLFYGNRTTQEIMFKEELEDLKNEHMERLQLHYLFSREEVDSPLLSGRIVAEHCEKYMKYLVGRDDISRTYLCGPFEMIMSMKDALIAYGLGEDQVAFELFFNPENAEGASSDATDEVLDEARRIRITLDGTTSDIDVDRDKDILQLAADSGLDLPYSCKGGVCATCKARVVAGDVDMKVNFALEEEEVEDGYVLTCQAHVKSDFVHVDFDQ